ncbi:MAG: MFS transporter [Oscillospiraceae bacterium]
MPPLWGSSWLISPPPRQAQWSASSAISNTLGRFLGGAMSDRFGPFRVVIFLYLVNAATMFSMKLMTSFVLYALAVAILACSFGGMVGAYPSIVLDYFGKTYYSVNYGLVFLAFGIGGLLGPQIVSQVLRLQNGDYTLAFWIAGGAGIAGALLALLCRKPVPGKRHTS